ACARTCPTPKVRAHHPSRRLLLDTKPSHIPTGTPWGIQCAPAAALQMRTVEMKHRHTQRRQLPRHPCQTDGGKSSSFGTPCTYQNVLAEELREWQAEFPE